ncbi:MAG: hypothetical protein ACP5VN_03310 [Acidobacteriota bacterium]
MAKGIGDLDWITIKYKDIYALVGILLALVVVLGGGFLYIRWKGNPQIQAERALSRAQRLIDSLDGASSDPALMPTLNQAKTMLAQGRSEYAEGRYPKARQIALDIIETLKDLQASSPSGQKYATLVETEGNVEVKRTGQHLFSSAKERMILEDGDIVRTGQNSFAKIKYHNGQFQVVAPDSLVVIQSLSSTPDGASRVEVALKQGFVETQTPETMTPKDQSIITTDTAKVRPAPASRVGIAQSPTGETTASIFAGAGEIESGGRTQRVEAGTSGVVVRASAGTVSAPEPLVAPPVADFPKDQQILRVEDPVHTPLTFQWKGGSGGPVRFQLSARPLFSSLVAPDQVLKENRLTVEGLPPGTYYWRLKSESGAEKSFWSPIYRFRLLQIYQRPRIQRDLKLIVEATPIGDGVILQGSTDPGVSVSVNDLEIPVNADGSFSKIYLFSDVGTQSVVVRAFDEEGNEKFWRKQFQSVSY